MSKDSGFRIRVEKDLRDEFIELCRSQDRPAAQVVREFMREYLKKNTPANDSSAPAPRKKDMTSGDRD